MKPITVLHVIDTLQTGGTESQLLRILPRLEPGVFRQVLCPQQKTGSPPRALRPAPTPPGAGKLLPFHTLGAGLHPTEVSASGGATAP